MDEKLSILHRLSTGETLQFFTAINIKTGEETTFIVDHAVFATATSYLNSLYKAGVPFQVYDYVRTATQAEADRLIATIRNREKEEPNG